jgi:plasmid stabilization system protein ParE
MKVLFSRLAIFKLEKLSQYLSSEWSEQSKITFLKKLDSKINIIQQHPEIFPQSEFKPGLRKCMVTKQTSLLYEVGEDSIFILTIIDTRQNQEKIKQEIQKNFP